MTEQQTLPSEPSPDSQQDHDDHWRNEITARIAGYSRRRGRRIEGAFSMRFPFPPAETGPASGEERTAWETDAEDSAAQTFSVASAQANAPVQSTRASVESDTVSAVTVNEPQSRNDVHSGSDIDSETREPISFADDAAPQLVPANTAAASSRPRSKPKVIAFPRQASSAPEIVHRLADPVVPEQPRILDVPEELEAYPAAPLLDGLQFLASPHAAATPPADHVELPFQAVDLSRRLYAGAIDCALVAVAAGMFGAVCYKMLPQLALTKPVLLIAAGMLVLLWGIYEYIFTMYACATPGMRMLRLRLNTFKGGRLGWRHRRSRIFGLYFSTASLMMGVLWALVDVDALCWHDRISRTYLSKQE